MALPLQSDPTKVVGRRVLAALLDAVVVFIPLIALVSSGLEYLPEDRLGRSGSAFCEEFLAEGGTRICLDATGIDERVYFSDSLPAGSTLASWLIPLLLFVVLQGLTGWTPGKLLTGIRVVRDDGRPPGLVKAFLRWVLWIVDGFPYVLPLVGFITALTTVGHRRVGDMAAGTYVVRSSAAGQPVSVPGLTAPPAPPGQVTGVPWATTAPPSAPVAAPGPQWDQARGTYIQWDPSQGAWLQWDEAGRAWVPIPGQ